MKIFSKKIAFVIVALAFIAYLPFSMTVYKILDQGKSTNPSFVYAGTRTDLSYICVPADGEWKVLIWVVKVRSVIDLPFSVVADTLCLPYAVYRAIYETGKVSMHYVSKEEDFKLP